MGPMNSFREIVLELSSAFEMAEPVISDSFASIEFDGINLTINDLGSGLNFSALIGAMPTTSPKREEATRKLLQGSMSILRSHSILIHTVNKQGHNFIAIDYKVTKNETNIHDIKSKFSDFQTIAAAVKEIITEHKPNNVFYSPPVNPEDNADEIEFVFRA